MCLTETLLIKGLTKLATDPQAIGRLLNVLDSPMPNIETQLVTLLKMECHQAQSLVLELRGAYRMFLIHKSIIAIHIH